MADTGHDGTDLSALRREYAAAGLEETDLAADPTAMFGRWFEDVTAAGVHEPNAMVLSTVAADFAPSSRMVLLKGFSAEGFVFYTNTRSRKGRDLAGNPRCALLFPWHPLERQVRVEGVAVLLDRGRVEDYFAARPRESQLGAWASHQSTVVADRDELSASYGEAEVRWQGQEVPVPEEWGGYLVRHECVEFWQGRRGRMHDRLVYRRAGADGETWATERLSP